MKIKVQSADDQMADSLKMATLKFGLSQFDKTRSIAKACEICDWLIENLDMPKTVKVRR